MSDSTILKVHDLNVNLEHHQILQAINFSVEKGDVVAIVGPNGAGKSVLFRALLDLIPYSGTINFAPSSKISYVPQRFAIDRDFPLDVMEFMQFKTKDTKKITEVLNQVGITDSHVIHHHLFKQRLGWLSGGQLQRVLIAWALIDDPDLLLFDEPTSGIDIGGEETIYHLLQSLNEQRQLTIIMISHDLNIVYRYAKKVICLNKELVCYGIPEAALTPEALSKLYGSNVSIYSHQHEAHHQ